MQWGERGAGGGAGAGVRAAGAGRGGRRAGMLTLNLAIVSVLSRREEPPEGALAPPPPFIIGASARCAGRAALDIINK